jgi:hypothetical protein
MQQVQPYRAAQHLPFQLTSFADQFFHRVAVCHAAHVLIDDGSLIQFRGYVVARRTNKLHAPLVRLLVRLASHKRRKERVVDIDDAIGVAIYKRCRQHLHVTRKHYQFNVERTQQQQLFVFLFALRLWSDWKNVKGNVERINLRAKIGMVAHHRDDFAGKFAGPVSVQHFKQAVVVLGWRRLALPKRIETWSLTSLQQRLVKTGGRLVKHARHYWLLLAEGHLNRRRFGAMLGRIALLPVPTG